MDISIGDRLECDSDHKCYDITIFNDQIHTLVTHDAHMLEHYLYDILSDKHNQEDRSKGRLIIGLDIEWCPSFNRNNENPPAILQLCVGKRCCIFQLSSAPEIPETLGMILNLSDIKFVGVGIQRDVEKLIRFYNLRVANFVELGPLAAEKFKRDELRNDGLKDLAKEVLGLVIDKPRRVTLSRWDAAVLATDQIQYASVDAYLSYEIGKKLISRK
ncbi:hypothetical protein AQUCO_00300492v1 [Aquilegia coerulea]|uniref:3'-5' exonuclease domain-containing protein n=1 Tax=Aquilegia coerulea TaxID=218851 RepID=A0A2G5EZ19_AQUCA|nr:hypothetical protein AQUCO_00300492v1 [Aquilegia coerulea]